MLNIELSKIKYGNDVLQLIVLGVKYINDKVSQKIINEEIEQLTKIDIKYYKLGFILKNGFNKINGEYNLITLDDIYSMDE